MTVKRLKPVFFLAASLLTACGKPVMYKSEPVLDQKNCLVTQETVTKQDDEVVSTQKELLATEDALNTTKKCIDRNLKSEDIKAHLTFEQDRLEAAMKLSVIRAGVNLGHEFDRTLNRKIIDGLESKISKIKSAMQKAVLATGHTAGEFYDADIAGLVGVLQNEQDESVRLQAARELLLIYKGTKYAGYEAAPLVVGKELSEQGMTVQDVRDVLEKEMSGRLIGCRTVHQSTGKLVRVCR